MSAAGRVRCCPRCPMPSHRGRVTAIDADPAAVAAAGALVAAASLANVTVRNGRADRTDLPVESCDVVMLRHVLAHNGGGEDAIVAHVATLLRPGGCLYLVDADGTAMRTVPEDVDLADLQQRYLTFHTARRNDVCAGLRLGERLVRAGLELLEFRGTYLIDPVPAGMRTPPWAARDAMVAAGVATEEDVARWASAFDPSMPRLPDRRCSRRCLPRSDGVEPEAPPAGFYPPSPRPYHGLSETQLPFP
jgi:SAM-dependent methyltransferase